ncbi:GGDEF domain-containing protein [Amycolatopsis minnesotensis]|uniref:GGDEF domain-containing protein n=1 Tax=Amycolatopsis minnesotensis TaxID=337894 RepID=A0ABP5DTE7_9PSEU
MQTVEQTCGGPVSRPASPAAHGPHCCACGQALTHPVTVDRLTGLLDRWGWTDTAEPLFADARARGEDLALLMLDLDRFKQINDVLGHLAGDDALRAVGTALASHTRGEDVVGRYGGDEFLLLLPGAGLPVAHRIAARAMAALTAATVRVDTISGTTTTLTGLTASAGLAVFDAGHDTSLSRFILRADAALRDAKQRGRGRLRVIGSRPPRPPADEGKRRLRLVPGVDTVSAFRFTEA